jgi:hypothetical protein
MRARILKWVFIPNHLPASTKPKMKNSINFQNHLDIQKTSAILSFRLPELIGYHTKGV